jgi:hypothetical protein
MDFYPVWIDGYSNCGTKIKTAAIKTALKQFQEKYPNQNYELLQSEGLWFIGRRN